MDVEKFLREKKAKKKEEKRKKQALFRIEEDLLQELEEEWLRRRSKGEDITKSAIVSEALRDYFRVRP